MRILVTAKDRKVARETAERLFPPMTRTKVDQYRCDEGPVLVGIFGEDLKGQQFDRIVVAQQKHLSEVYSAYLVARIAVGGRFDRAD